MRHSHLSANKAAAHLLVACALIFLRPGIAQSASEPPPGWAVKERGPHHRKWESIQLHTNRFGNIVYHTNHVTELAAGIHYPGTNGNWIEAEETINLAEDGAHATKGLHKVRFSPDLAVQGAIGVRNAEGEVLYCTPLALSLTDRRTGTMSWIAFLGEECPGELHAPNRVIYPDALVGDGFTADVRCIYTRGGLETDVVLNGPIPSPTDLGFADSDAVLLEVWTEFYTETDPAIQTRVLRPAEPPSGTRPGLPAFLDDSITFGSWQIGIGTAFAEPNNDSPSIPVAKYWFQDPISNRKFLIESVEWRTVSPNLAATFPDRKPGKPGQLQAGLLPRPPLGGDHLPQSPPASLTSAPRPMRHADTASIRSQTAGNNSRFVLDWSALSTASDVTFDPRETYYVSGVVSLNGTTTIQPGTIVKFAPGARLEVNGTLQCLATPYRPATFTARDDNSIGEPWSSSSGTPSGQYAQPALQVNTASSTLQNVRFLHAHTGIKYSLGSSGEHILKHVQFLHCLQGVESAAPALLLRNALAVNCNRVLAAASGSTPNIRVEHLTAHDCANLGYPTTTPPTVYLTNSLFVNVTATAGYDAARTAQLQTTSDGNTFATAGIVKHYLAETSPARQQATATINSSLEADLRQRTTRPPTILSGSINRDVVLRPLAPKVRPGKLDLGWHYPVIDYLASYATLDASAHLTLADGAVLAGDIGAYSDPALIIRDGTITTTGTPIRPSRILQIPAWQEASGQPGPSAAVIGASPLTATSPAILTCAFTEWIAFNHASILDWGQTFTKLSFRDSSFFGGRLTYALYGAPNDYARWTNCLFADSEVTIYKQAPSPISLNFDNNSFLNSYLSIDEVSAAPSSYTSRNLFALGSYSDLPDSVTTAFNAYSPDSYAFGAGAGTSDLALTSLTFAGGAFGSAYIASSTASIQNVGSTYASSLGLSRHTISATAGTSEGTSLLDIGFHYVSANSSGLPLDTDGDGIPDYLEDRNGDQSLDSGETDPTSYTSSHGLGNPGLVILTPLRQ